MKRVVLSFRSLFRYTWERYDQEQCGNSRGRWILARAKCTVNNHMEPPWAIFDFVTGLPYGNPVRKWVEFLRFITFIYIYFIFSVSRKWKSWAIGLSCHSPAKFSLCIESSARIFVRFQGLVEMRRFYPVDTVQYLINLQWGRSHCNVNGVLGDLWAKYTLIWGSRMERQLDKEDRRWKINIWNLKSDE